MVTDQRAVFYPHGVDSATGGVTWECELASISRVQVAPRGRNPFDGSMRRRLQIDGGAVSEYFVVNKVADVVAAIEEAARR
jgi:hypothetical protein